MGRQLFVVTRADDSDHGSAIIVILSESVYIDKGMTLKFKSL